MMTRSARMRSTGGGNRLPIVAIIGRTRLYCECLARVLIATRKFAVVHLAADDVVTKEGDTGHSPDLVLLDLPEALTTTVVRVLRQLLPKTRFIGLNVDDEDDTILRMLGAGLDGFVVKDAPVEALHSAIENAVRGESSCPIGVLMRLARRIPTHHGGAPRALSSREREVIHLVEQGLTNKEIAVRLGVEAATVKNHIHHIMGKLSVHRRMDAVTQLRGSKPFD
jgi:DNA-binding NarL/FixJ family response regulator